MDQPDQSGLWMVPYADLMSTLVILFMALFAYSYSSRTPEVDKAMALVERELADTSRAERAQARLDEADAAVRIQDDLRRLGLSEFGVQITDRRVRITLPSPVLFGEGADRLEPGAKPVVDALATLIAGLPNPVLVEGHTDSVPVTHLRFRSNWELSAARAFAVIERLSRSGIPAGRFHARGYGEHRPVAPNDTASGRRRNRRIELSLVRESREGPPS